MTLLIFYLLGCLSLVLFSLSSLCICDGFSFSLPLSLSLSPATRLRLRTRTASESSLLNNNNNNKSKSKSKSKSTIQYAMHNTNKLSLLFSSSSSSSSSSSATSDTSGSSSSTTNTGDEDGGSNSSSSDHEKKDDTNNNNNNNNNNNDYSLNQNELDIQYSKFPRTWVPIASVYELDPNRPTPQIFLNQKYVCYLDQPSGQWIIMDDICPHRLAPLSEGRINRIITSTSTSTSTSESESESETDTDNETDKKGKNNKNKNQEISSTTLQCSYHGWEYDGLNNGKCIKIPQAHNSEIEKIAIASLSKSCVKSYSVIIHKNILWFWPWKLDSLSIIGQNRKYPNGIMESISNSNIGAVNNNNNGAIVNPATYTRDLPYGWDTLVENLIDPAHIPFAHHNLQGKRDDAIPIYMSIPESFPNTITIGGTVGDNNNNNDNDNDNDNTTVGDDDNTTKNENDGGETGFYFEWSDRTRGKHRGGTGEFNAPYGVSYNAHYYDTEDEMLEKRGTHLIKLKNKLATNNNNNNGEVVEADEADKEKDDTGFKLGVLCIPTKPGWSRAIVMAGPSKEKGDDKEVVVVKKEETKEKETKKKKKKSLIGMIFSIIPVWVTHLLSNKFLDSDLAFLHYQEQERLRHIQDGKYDGGSNGYYMPAQSDRCISALRKWIPKYTNYLGDKNNKYELPNTIPRKELFDRYVQHTSHCRHCQKGLKQLQTKIKPRLYGLMTISILAGGFNLFRGYKLITKLIALISFGLIRFITTQIEPAFKEGEFKHYENH